MTETSTRYNADTSFEMCGCLACVAIERCNIIKYERAQYKQKYPDRKFWTEK